MGEWSKRRSPMEPPTAPMMGSGKWSKRVRDDPREPIGIGQALVQGAASGLEGIGTMLDIPGMVAAPGAPPLYGPIGHQVGEAGLEAIGMPRQEPVYTEEKVVEMAARGATQALPFGLAGITRHGVKHLAGEVASGVAGELGAGTAEAMGAGPVGQAMTSFAAGAGAYPVGRGAGGVTARAAENLIPSVRTRAATQMASERLGKMVSSRPEAARRLGQEIEQQPYGTSLTTGQTLEPIAPEIGGVEAALARERPELHATIREQRLANLRTLRDRYEESLKGGDPADLTEGYRRAYEEADAGVKQAYSDVGEAMGIPSDRVKDMAAEIRRDAGPELAHVLPSDVITIENYGPTVSLSNLRRLRTSVSQRARGAERDPERAMEGRYLAMIKESVDRTMDDMVERGTQQHASVLADRQVERLRDAIAKRDSVADRFGKKSVSWKTLIDEEQPSEAFRKIMSSKRPVEEIRRIRRAIGDDEAAEAGLRKLMRDYAFGEDFLGAGELSFGDVAAEGLQRGSRRVEGNLMKPKVRAAMREVFGGNADRDAIDFVRRVHAAQRGKSGTSGAPFMSTGRNAPDLVSQMSDFQSMGALMRRVVRMMGREKTEQEALDIIYAAMVDKRIARGLFEGPLPRGPERVLKNRLDQWLAAAARASIQLEQVAE